MARRTVRVELPTSKPDQLIDLGERIVTRSAAPGASGTLDPDRVARLATVTGTAKTNHINAEAKAAESQVARQSRDTTLGIAKGQSANTPDTVLKHILSVRDQLLIEYEGNEEKLSEFGFDVAIGTAKSPARRNGNGQTHTTYSRRPAARVRW